MTNHDLEVTVHGTPIPQGSKSGFLHKTTKRVIVMDSNAKRLKPWREHITAATFTAAAHQGYEPAEGPMRVDLTFYFDRPAYHFGTGRNAARLKPGAPTYVDVKPDIDKLVRAVLDGLTDGNALTDDARVAILHVAQLYCPPGQPAGLLARVRPIEPVVLMPEYGIPREEWVTVEANVPGDPELPLSIPAPDGADQPEEERA